MVRLQLNSYCNSAIVFVLFSIAVIQISWVYGYAYHKSARHCPRTIQCFAAMGFGKEGGLKKTSNKISPATGSTSPSMGDKKKLQLQQRILQEYGGDIAKGTQVRIDKYMADQPPHIQLAAQLYRKITRWDAYMNTLTPQQREALVPPKDVDTAEQTRRELQYLYHHHGIDDLDMHNLFQKFTWDASADAKAARAVTGQMPAAIQQRVNHACEIIGKSVRSVDGRKGRCLDVGCGYGVLVKSLLNCGILTGQYTGVDLSSEMIRNAKETYRGMNFISADFIKDFQDSNDHNTRGFDGIIFCSSLHDLPNLSAALEKAATLLRPEGRIVIVHPQGARHVIEQRTANPTMVKRPLPMATELHIMAKEWSLVVEHAPKEPDSREDEEQGYLAVLSKPTRFEE